MGPISKNFLKVRVQKGGDPGEWELFAPDGTPIEGWYHLAVGRDHSGRYTLQVTFDQFECVNADGQPVEVHLTCPTAKPHEKFPPLPRAGMHRHQHEGEGWSKSAAELITNDGLGQAEILVKNFNFCTDK